MTKQRRSLAVSAPASERGDGFRAVGVAVSKLAAPIVAKRSGGVLARLKAEWVTIIGPELAPLVWPTGYGRDGDLKLRTVPLAAIEIQHRAPLVIERINLYLGRSAVSRLVLVQASPPTSLRPAAASEAAGAGGPVVDGLALATIADPDLRAALARFAAAIAARHN